MGICTCEVRYNVLYYGCKFFRIFCASILIRCSMNGVVLASSVLVLAICGGGYN